MRARRLPLRLFASAVVLTLTVAASGAIAANDEFVSAQQQPSRGGTVVVSTAYGGRAVGLNNLTATAGADRGLTGAQVYDRLYSNTLATGLRNELATDTKVSSDGLSWAITLRRGVKFHDGTPFNAAAVKVNLNLRRINPTFRLYSLLEPIRAVRTVGRYKVQILLKQPVASLRLILSSPDFGIQSPTAMKRYGQDDYYRHAAGTGPFRLQGTPSESKVTFVRNPDYWGPSPYIDRIEFTTIPDPNSGFAALQAGQVHILRELPDGAIGRVRSDRNLAFAPRPPFTEYIWFNMAAAPTSQLRVRQAIVHGIDTASFLRATPGVTTQSRSLVPSKGIFGYAAQKPYAFNLAQARQLLSSAGIPPGTPLNVLIPNAPTVFTTTGQLLARSLETLGFDVNLQVLDSTAWFARVGKSRQDADWHVALFGGAPLYADAEAVFYRSLYGPSEAPSGQNFSHYRNNRFDRLLEQQHRMSDPKARQKILTRLQQMTWNTLPMFSPAQITLLGASRKVRGIDYDTSGLYMLHRAWLEK